jgi:hypothetical protein
VRFFFPVESQSSLQYGFSAHIQSSEFILFVINGISKMGGKTAKNGNSVSDNQEWKVLG